MANPRHYRIEPYRKIPGEFTWSPAPDDRADLWLLLGHRGDDHRCFGAFASRAGAEQALAYVQQPDWQPKQTSDDHRPAQAYHASRRNGTEDEFIIHAPGGREMAYIWFWDQEYDQPGVGDQEARADVRRIVDALNAYRQPGATPDRAAAARAPTTTAYHARPARGPFDTGDAIDIHAPDGRAMAFIPLPERPADPEAHAAQADARLIVTALNAYQPPPPQHSQKAGGITGTLAKQLDAAQPPSPPRRPPEPERSR